MEQPIARNELPPHLAKFLSIEPDSKWLMSPVERLVIVGLLELLRPSRTLELGHRFGGCTEWLARYSGEVYSVDIDAAVIESSKRWPNVRPIHADTKAAMRELEGQGLRFGFALIDADHSFEAARDDLLVAARLTDVIVLHDSFNPVCRAGYVAALAQLDAYSDLDLADGHIQTDGLWGGLGIVVPGLPRSTPRQLTPRLLNQDILAHEQQVRTSRRYRARHIWNLLTNLRPRNLEMFRFDG
jgi:hypothetical protein